MGRTKGEGRTPAEKSQRMINPPGSRAAQREREKEEEERWAALAGPVVVRKKDQA